MPMIYFSVLSVKSLFLELIHGFGFLKNIEVVVIEKRLFS